MLDLVGKKFGLLTVLSFDKIYKHKSYWICLCSCGRQCSKMGKYLNNGDTKSCGLCQRTKHEKIVPGMQFGRLKVIKSEKRAKRYFYHCECECGNLTISSGSSLTTGQSKSCGCIQKKDLSGQRFGMLMVNYVNGSDKHNKRLWSCKCDCGEVKDITHSSLTSGKTRSCGCTLRRKGKDHPNWKAHLTDKDRKYSNSNKRYCPEFREWKKAVLARDGKICLICGTRENIEIHHLNAWFSFPNQRFDPNNGVVLCEKHHTEFHSIYGNGYNTKGQFEEYLEKKNYSINSWMY